MRVISLVVILSWRLRLLMLSIVAGHSWILVHIISLVLTWRNSSILIGVSLVVWSRRHSIARIFYSWLIVLAHLIGCLTSWLLRIISCRRPIVRLILVVLIISLLWLRTIGLALVLLSRIIVVLIWCHPFVLTWIGRRIIISVLGRWRLVKSILSRSLGFILIRIRITVHLHHFSLIWLVSGRRIIPTFRLG